MTNHPPEIIQHTPEYGLGVYLPRAISPCAIFIASVLLWLVPLSIWAYATRPENSAAVGSAPILASHNGPAPIASASTDTAGRKVSQ